MEMHGFTYKKLNEKEDKNIGMGEFLQNEQERYQLGSSQETNHTSYLNRRNKQTNINRVTEDKNR